MFYKEIPITKIILFQHDFNLAALSWMESGIHQKMENDITTAKAFRGYFKDAFWTRNETAHNDAPLKMEHVFPSFILLGYGLGASVIAFFGELLYHLHGRRVAMKTSGSSLRPISKIPDDVATTTKRLEEVEITVTFSFN